MRERRTQRTTLVYLLMVCAMSLCLTGCLLGPPGPGQAEDSEYVEGEFTDDPYEQTEGELAIKKGIFSKQAKKMKKVKKGKAHIHSASYHIGTDSCQGAQPASQEAIDCCEEANCSVNKGQQWIDGKLCETQSCNCGTGDGSSWLDVDGDDRAFLQCMADL